MAVGHPGAPWVALACSSSAGALVREDDERVLPLTEWVAEIARLDRELAPRWVCWSVADGLGPAVAARIPLRRVWDIAESHRLLMGGWRAEPQLAWAAAHGLPLDDVATAPRGDLFDFTGMQPDHPVDGTDLVDARGHLRGDAGSPDQIASPAGLIAYARAALTCARRQEERARSTHPRLVSTTASESAAAVLCAEMQRDGLPVDRAVLEDLIAMAAGPRPADEADARRTRRRRDQEVLAHAPGRESTDLRNPAQVRELLASVGVVVPDTRKWTLTPYRASQPLVDALLQWRRDERIATTYGYHWLDSYVGQDDRLRGRWTVCDGAAGRMTAQNGLHNLPVPLRGGVAAHPGHVLVRADLGQVEPRVLAVVSGDRDFAAATQADDLYRPVADQLGVERAVAKIAVLAAMYGQRSGAAGQALARLERAYPVAMSFLDQAYAAGVRRDPLRTFGGRLIPLGSPRVAPGAEPDTSVSVADWADGARGRFARNAVIQGAAAELFKAWAATVRATTADLDAQIVLCLHDELLVHVPAEHGQECLARVHQALADAARRWAGTEQVRFVADASVVHRWSEAKD